MNYFELRDKVKNIIPRKTLLDSLEKEKGFIKEKGRKSNYYQFDIEKKEMVTNPKLLDTEQINSFLEVSLRASHCPMPLNADVWDGTRCPFRCAYCYADAFKASLYSSFFDNAKDVGLRQCSPDYFKGELDKLMKYVGKKTAFESEVINALSMRIPMRLGIRYEDFHAVEARKGVSLEFLKYISHLNYPIMINTKSKLIGEDRYVRALADNKAGAAVHITAISADPELNKKIEPGAPPFLDRVWAMKQLTDAGIRVVARIEPFMVFVNDEKEQVDAWINAVRKAGVKHITLDTYSYSATAPGIRRQMERQGIDFERLFLLMSDSQWLGSLLIGKFIEYLRAAGFQCSTFDFGNVPSNDQDVCCEVGDHFLKTDGGYSRGNTLMAIRFIKSKSPNPVSWNRYNQWVESYGGWLSGNIKKSVFDIWNGRGNGAFHLDWAVGIEPYGCDSQGRLMWRYCSGEDFREKLLESIL